LALVLTPLKEYVRPALAGKRLDMLVDIYLETS
jgi:hypothetical protein